MAASTSVTAPWGEVLAYAIAEGGPNFLLPNEDGTHAGHLEPCPICGHRIPYGLAIQRGWHRCCYWCVHRAEAATQTETRLRSGATV